MAIGTLAGLFSGLFGVGGGSVIVPLLVLWLGLRRARCDRHVAGGDRLHRGLRRRRAGPLRQRARARRAARRRAGDRRGAVRHVAAAARGDALDLAAVRRACSWRARSSWCCGDRRDRDRRARRACSPDCSGVGGGVVFVPGLVILLGLDQHQAEATSLLAIVPVAIVGTYQPGSLRQRAPRRRAAARGCCRWPAPPAASCSPTRSRARSCATRSPGFMVIVAAQLVRRVVREDDGRAKPRHGQG